MVARIYSRLNLFVALAALVATLAAQGASAATWNVVGGGNWNSAGNWTSPTDVPDSPGESAIISNTLPSNWTATGENANIVEITAPINIDSLTTTDVDAIGNIAIQLRIDSNVTATIDTISFSSSSAGRSNIVLENANSRLNVRSLTNTQRFVDRIDGPGTLAFTDGSANGTATWNYLGGGQEIWRAGIKTEFSSLSTMNYNRVPGDGHAVVEGRDNTWIVGNTLGNQTWNTGNTGGTGTVSGYHELISRNAGGIGWVFTKVGAFDVFMGSAGPSDGISINRYTSGNFNSHIDGQLFTDGNFGATAGGTVTIAKYTYNGVGNVGGGTSSSGDTLGSNLTIDGAGFTMASSGDAGQDDVNTFVVMANKTLRVQAGNLLVQDGTVSTSNRMGIYFAGGTVDADNNFSVLGADTFLNGGAAGGTLRVGGNFTVQSQNPTGNATIAGLPSSVPNNGSVDDFDLRTSELVFDGGSNSTMNWDVNAAALGGNPTLTAGDFSLANFALGTLQVTNNTDVVLSLDQVLYLSENLIIDAGSTFTLLGENSELHIFDADLSELDRISGYLGSQLLVDGRGFQVTAGVGYSLVVLPVPEPSTAALMLCGLLLIKGRRRSGK